MLGKASIWSTVHVFVLRADDLGLSQTQMNSIGMLVHALYSNPKVLYAPNNTAANNIMNKVSKSVTFLDIHANNLTRLPYIGRKWFSRLY